MVGWRLHENVGWVYWRVAGVGLLGRIRCVNWVYWQIACFLAYPSADLMSRGAIKRSRGVSVRMVEGVDV